MTTKNFSVKNGLTVGVANIDATTGNILSAGNLSLTGNATAGNLITTGLANVGSLTVTGTSNLGAISNVTITGGSSGQVIQTNGSGGLSFTTISTSGVSNGTSSVSIPTVNGNINLVSAGNTTMVVTGTGANISGTLSVSGNANVGNLDTAQVLASANITAPQIISNVATGTAPFVVTSTTQVANLSVATAGSATTAGTVTTNAQPNITSTGTLASLSVSGNANVGNIGANNAVFTGGGSFGANLNMAANWINNVGYPVLTTDAASKAYVDTIASTGIAYHQPVNVATTTTLATATGGTITYNNGTDGVGANLVTTGAFLLIDGANVQTVGTRILVKDEANAAFNGIYTYANTTTIVRSTDADEYGPDSTTQLSINDYFFTLGGVVNEGTSFIVSAPAGNITFGTSNITFAVFSTSQVYDAGTGINITGTTISTTASQTNVTAVGTLTTLSVSGNANIGNIGTAQVLASANVTTPQFISNVTTGTAPFVVTSTTQVANLSVATAGTAGTVTTNAQPNITSTGTLASLSVSGNANVGNLGTAQVLASANITTPQFISNITTGTAPFVVTSTTEVANLNVATAGTAGTVTTNAQPNITSTGTLASLSVSGNANIGNIGTAQVLASANITSPQLISNVTTGTAPFVVTSTTQVANLNVATAGTAATVTTNAQPNITSTGTLASLSVSGNANIGNIGTGLITASSNITGANLITGGLISATGNVTSGNVSTGLVSLSTGLTSARSNVSVTTNTVIDQFAPATYRTAKYIISASSANGYQSVEALLVQDETNSYITIYGSVCSNAVADIIDISSNINGVSGNVAVYATSSGGTATVNIVTTYLKT
jgi:hypothetical protein